MARRVLLTALVVLLTAAPAAAAQPNVVVLMTDDQTAASLRTMPRVNGLLGTGEVPCGRVSPRLTLDRDPADVSEWSL